LGRHLEEIRVTWAQFWKEPDKMTIYLEDRLKNHDQSIEMESEKLLLSSDEFNATLAHIISLGITFGVERGLCMGRTDAEFEDASQNVSNFFLGAQAQFNEVVAAIPSTHFPFLAKISEAAESALPKVASIQPDKVVRSVVLLLLLPCLLLLAKCSAGLPL
ncbi:hypothetical protein Tco_1138046, partial [Tanacetum coccineum]